MFHHGVRSVITEYKLTPGKRDVNTVDSDKRSRFTLASIDDNNTSHTGEHMRDK